MNSFTVPHFYESRPDLPETVLEELDTKGADPSSDRASVSAWPKLSEIGLSGPQKEARNEGIGGSDANIILSGDTERINRLWEEKRRVRKAEDLSVSLPVMLGCWTEAFNRQWFEKQTGEAVSGVGQVLMCHLHDWRRCTLDGLVVARGAVWEAKHTSAFAKEDDVLARYMPQLQHNMAVAGFDRALLSVIFGNHKWTLFEVAADWLYQEELLVAESQFWNCVVNGMRPTPADPPRAPKPVGVREVCLEGSNVWGSAADDWRRNREASQRFAAATATLKSLVEDDVARAYGNGVEVKRSKAGALSVREFAS